MREGVIDIVFRDGYHYVKKENVSPIFELSVFEAFLKRQKLTFLHIKDTILENSRIPMITQAFYEYIAYYGKPLTQEGFYRYYFKRNCKDVGGDHFIFRETFGDTSKVTRNKFLLVALKGRIFRAYPSLIRDFHFFLLCRNSGKFDRVEYSLKEDCEGGVDLKVYLNDKKLKVRLFVNTRRAQFFLKKKAKRHTFLGEYIDIPMELDKGTPVGDFKLYNNSHVDLILDRMMEEEL